MNKTLYIDCETTGTDPSTHDIVQVALITEIDNQVKEIVDIKMKPSRLNNISQSALDIQGKTIEEIESYPDSRIGYDHIISIFDEHIDKYDKKDKFNVVGYNMTFDLNFLFQFFKQNGNPYLYSYIGNKIDVYGLVQFMAYMGHFNSIDNLRLQTVANWLDIDIDAHNAMSDVEATRSIFKMIEKNISIKGFDQ